MNWLRNGSLMDSQIVILMRLSAHFQFSSTTVISFAIQDLIHLHNISDNITFSKID